MKKYQIIYADPPWEYNKGVYQKFRPINQGKNRFITDFYSTMSLDGMKKLPIETIIDRNCVLFMWFTYSHFLKAIELCDWWGFKYKTIAFVWLKLSCNGKLLSNIGSWTMGNTEAVLIATKGNMLQYKKRNDIKQIVSPNTELRKRGNRHSQKPNEVRDRIVELFGDLPRIELFARQKTEGWDVWGNEVESDINLEA
ncbi:MAG: hypothetical protein KJ718_00845 [Nanoarchaeota archaeon]|nr:hypothetical protein [Nanoarchaeota archaeon]